MTTALRICGIAFIIAVLCWLVWLTDAYLDLREWRDSLGPDIDEAVDKVNRVVNHLHETEPITGRHADRRFSFGGGNDGRNFALSDLRTDEGMRGYPGGTESGSERPTRQANGNSEEARPHGE